MKNSHGSAVNGLGQGSFRAHETPDSKVISVEECKEYLGKFNLSDEKVAEIRNYLIGIIDKSINYYLDDFR